MVSALPTQLSQSRQTNQIIWSHTVIIVTLSKERTLAILQLFQPQNIQQDSKLLTSDSKKPGQAKVVVQYCSLSRFFWIRRYLSSDTPCLFLYVFLSVCIKSSLFNCPFIFKEKWPKKYQFSNLGVSYLHLEQDRIL